MKPIAIAPVLLIVAAVVSFPVPVHAGGRRRVPAASLLSAAPPLTLTLVDGGAVIDAGTLQWHDGATRTTRAVTLRIGEPSRESRGNATLRAYLQAPDARCIVRIDGVPLTVAPRVIRRNAPIGIAFTHRIDIEVPRTAAGGPLQASIGWEITTE